MFQRIFFYLNADISNSGNIGCKKSLDKYCCNEIAKFQFVCMINLNSILATYPEWGQKVPPLSLFGGEKRPRYSKVTPFCAPVF